MDPMTMMMAAQIGTQALGTLGSMAGAGMDAANAKASLKLQREALDWQKESFKHSAQYRMQDLENAGLNPALAAAQGMSFGGASGSVAPVTTHLSDSFAQAGRFLNDTQKVAISKQAIENALIQQTASAQNSVAQAKGQELINRRTALENNALQAYLTTKEGKEQTIAKLYGTPESKSFSGLGFGGSVSKQVAKTAQNAQNLDSDFDRFKRRFFK